MQNDEIAIFTAFMEIAIFAVSVKIMKSQFE